MGKQKSDWTVERITFNTEMSRALRDVESLAETFDDDRGTEELLREAGRKIREARARYEEKRGWK